MRHHPTRMPRRIRAASAAVAQRLSKSGFFASTVHGVLPCQTKEHRRSVLVQVSDFLVARAEVNDATKRRRPSGERGLMRDTAGIFGVAESRHGSESANMKNTLVCGIKPQPITINQRLSRLIRRLSRAAS